MVMFGLHIEARKACGTGVKGERLTEWAGITCDRIAHDNISPQMRVFGQISPHPTTPSGFNWGGDHELVSLLEGFVEGYWGRYIAVAVSSDKSAIAVLPDPTGTVDVFYRVTPERVDVADSLQGLVGEAQMEMRPNLSYLGDVAFALERYGPATLLEGVQRICCGHALIIPASGSPYLQRVWPRLCKDTEMSLEAASTQLISILEKVCAEMGSPKGGVLLSGGRDSALIAAIMAHVAVSNGTQLSCAHIGNDMIGSESEVDFARLVAERVGSSFHVIDREAYVAGFSLQRGTHDAVSDYPVDRTDALLAESLGGGVALDGRGGDSIFLEDVKAGHISAMPAGKVLKMDIGGGNLGKLLYGKLVARLRPAQYLAAGRNTFASSFTEAGLLTDQGNATLAESRNLEAYQDDMRFFARRMRSDKATYLSTVLTDMVYQNERPESPLDVRFPLISQPVLDFLFSLDLRILLSTESRTLQRAMLKALDLPELAARRYKTGVTSIVMQHFSRFEQELMRILSGSPFSRAGLIDFDKVDSVFAAYRHSITHCGGHGVYRLVRSALAFRGLGL